ncbi:hypothetical protein EKO27_g5297 [Xylaria grammica]|uniref:Methyltransferase domain-containing protein n=1 Tax=Xylaria grammica TaxID=363999 RepID=A0A439D5Z7_9PEZI|nr:hypothetical protein EKO27_g5297 [Xylaria grammica]
MTSTAIKEKYVMRENEGELERLANHHEIISHYIGGLVLAPVDLSQPNLRILDSGTADGLWLRELKSSTAIENPHTYIGTDINESFFPFPPPRNLFFHVQSITRPWPDNWHGTFDYVHQRLTLPGAGPVPIATCVSNLARLVKPGGWVELMEADFTGSSSNGPAAKLFEKLMAKFLDTIGVGFTYARTLPSLLENAGLENVQHKSFVIEYGAACPDEALGAKGISHLLSTSVGMLAFLKGLPGKDVDGEISRLPETLDEELKSRGACFTMIAAWGQQREDGNGKYS